MDKKLMKIFIDIIDKKNNHHVYYTNEYYLKNIFLMLNDIVK